MTGTGAVDLAGPIIAIPDHPKPGVVFRDITPMLADPECLRAAVDRLADWARPRRPDVVAAVDARGFILGGGGGRGSATVRSSARCRSIPIPDRPACR